MDSLTSELDSLITLIKTKDNSISSQKELNFIQNKALQEITSNLRNREYETYFKYLDFFLSIDCETEWNFNNQFHIDVIEFVETILKVMDVSTYARLRNDLKISGHLNESQIDLLTLPVLAIFMKICNKDNDQDNLSILNYYCGLKENYDTDDDYIKNLYLKKISILENYMTSLKSENKEQILKLIPFIEDTFEKNIHR
ncbi:unnamed protein product [Hanseniaspora opuntiae]